MNFGTTAFGMIEAVINTTKTFLTMVKPDQVSANGLNATSL